MSVVNTVKEIDCTNLLIKKFGRRIVDGEVKHINCHVCEICSTNCLEERPSDDCDFSIIDKEDMVKKLFIYSKVPIPEEDIEDIDKLYRIGMFKYGIGIDDMYFMDTLYKVCDTCNGTGVIINHTPFDSCTDCNGTGLIERDNSDAIITEFVEGHTFCNCYSNETSIEDIRNKRKHLGDSYIHELAYVNRKYLKYIKEFSFESDNHKPGYKIIGYGLDYDKKYIVWDKDTNQILVSGNYIKIHDKMDLPYYMDIEFISDNRYDVCEESEFWNSHKLMSQDTNTILSNDIYDNMRNEIITTGLLLYVRNATYDCEELVERYVNKYSTVDMIVENVMHHIDETENSVVANSKIPYLNKIIADGKLIGMELSQLQAAKIMESVISLNNEEFYPTFLSYNAIVIFIVESICISGEFASLMDD